MDSIGERIKQRCVLDEQGKIWTWRKEEKDKVLEGAEATVGEKRSKAESTVKLKEALDVDEDILTERLINREKESGRVDDQDKSKIKNRFEEYNNKTSKLIEYYNNQNKFYQVEGLGEINEITQRIYNLIDTKI